MSTELTEDDSRAYGVVQAFSLLLSGGALYVATLLSYRGGEVFLGLDECILGRIALHLERFDHFQQVNEMGATAASH